MRSFAEIITMIPSVASRTSTGNSKRSRRSRVLKSRASSSPSAADSSASTFMKPEKASATYMPPSAVPSPCPRTSTAVSRSAPITAMDTGKKVSRRGITPTRRITRPETASTSSGRARVQFMALGLQAGQPRGAAQGGLVPRHQRRHAGLEEGEEGLRVDPHPERQQDQRREDRVLARREVQQRAQVVPHYPAEDDAPVEPEHIGRAEDHAERRAEGDPG